MRKFTIQKKFQKYVSALLVAIAALSGYVIGYQSGSDKQLQKFNVLALQSEEDFKSSVSWYINGLEFAIRNQEDICAIEDIDYDSVFLSYMTEIKAIKISMFESIEELVEIETEVLKDVTYAIYGCE